MGSFEIIEHTADVGVVATGDSFGDALAWLAKGMFSVIADTCMVEPRESIEVSITSSNPESLVVDWLNEMLYMFDGEGFLFSEFDIHVSDDRTSLDARCRGEAADHERHEFLTDVKAATYHNLEISHNDQWRIRAILDV